LSNDPFIKLQSVRGNQRNIFDVGFFSNIPKQGQRVLIAASADHGRTPKPRPDLDGGEDPRWLLLSLDDRSDLVGLKFRGPEPGCFFIIEVTAAVARFFQPAIDGIPGNALDSSDSEPIRRSTVAMSGRRSTISFAMAAATMRTRSYENAFASSGTRTCSLVAPESSGRCALQLT
jgi:hypothetical protein